MRLVGPDPTRVDDAASKSYVDQVEQRSRAYVDQQTAPKVAQVVVDFGPYVDETGTNETTASGVAFASWASAGQVVTCVPDPDGTADHGAEDAMLEGVRAVVTYVEPGLGFDVVAYSSNGTWGRYLFNCVVC